MDSDDKELKGPEEEQTDIYKVDPKEAEPGVKLKPLSPERAAEVAAQFQSIRATQSYKKTFEVVAVALMIILLGGIFYFVQRTRWDAKMSVGRHNYLFVKKKIAGLKKLGPGFDKPVEFYDDMTLLNFAELDVKAALGIFPGEFESKYLLYKIYELKLDQMKEEMRVYNAHYPKDSLNRVEEEIRNARSEIEKIDPNAEKSKKVEERYAEMSAKKVDKALNKIFNK